MGGVQVHCWYQAWIRCLKATLAGCLYQVEKLGMGTAWEADKHSPCFVRAVTEFKTAVWMGKRWEGGLQGGAAKVYNGDNLVDAGAGSQSIAVRAELCFPPRRRPRAAAGYRAAPGERVAVHEFGLSRQVSMGLSIAGLDEGSEYVPVFCADGSPRDARGCCTTRTKRCCGWRCGTSSKHSACFASTSLRRSG